MSKDKDLLGSLPGSSHGGGREGVTNHTLMPKADKLPGMPAAPKASTPAPNLLGSGNKIPESQESRMRSQFASPDPAIYARKKHDQDFVGDQTGLAGEVRSSIPISTYKSDPSAPTLEGSGLLAGRNECKRAEKAAASEAKMKANTAAEHKRLMGQKEMMLSTLCSNPTIRSGSTEAYRVVNVVMDINKKLGLPVNNMGSWKLPD